MRLFRLRWARTSPDPGSTDLRAMLRGWLAIGIGLGIFSGGGWPAAWGAPAELGGLERELTVDPSQLVVTDTPSGRAISLPGWTDLPDARGYLLPVQMIVIELPPGETVRAVQAVSMEKREIPLSGAPRRETGDPAAAPGDFRFGDESLVTLGGQGSMGGEGVAVLIFRGVSYDETRAFLLLHTRVQLSLELIATGENLGVVRPIRQSTAAGRYRAGLLRGVTGAAPALMKEPAGSAGEVLGDFGFFQPGQYPSLDGSLVEYVIITSDDLATEFQRLADWKTRSGVPAVVRTVSWIEARYAGVDRQERIRNFIRDAYQYWGTVWVLLAGNESIVPSRQAHIAAYGGEDIAADLYYSDLDEFWDGDGDGIFGEGYNPTVQVGDSLDLYPDVLVGRAPVGTTAEAQIFIDKTFTYQRTPAMGYQTDALFIGEVVFPTPWNPGDPIFLNGCDLAHDAGRWVPAGWDTTYLCEWPNQNETHASVVSALNAGPSLVTVVGHGDPFKWSTSDGYYFLIPDAMGLANYRKYFTIFYANCNTNQTESESINEFLLLNTHGGAVASVAATRYDFPSIGRYYHEEFYRLFYRSRIREVGALQALMKVPRVPLSGSDLSAERWTQLTYILFGDPGLPLWLVVPQTATLTVPPSITLGDSVVTIGVQGGSPLEPVEGALVTLWKADTGEYARGITGLAGSVELPFRPGSLGPVLVTATHGDFLPKLDTLDVVTGAPRLFVSDVVVDDDSLGASAGNSDGVFDAGERVELRITLENQSGTAVDSVAASLRLAGSGTLGASLEVDGLPAPRLLFLGADRVRPEALPVSLGFAPESLAVWGRPTYAASAPEDTSGGHATGRAYVWQDASGWHLRAAGGEEAHAFTGYVVTDGSFHSVAGQSLEEGDGYETLGDSVSFSFAVDSTEFEDGLDLVPADSQGVAVLQGAAGFGLVPPGGLATDTLLVEAVSQAAARRALRFGLSLTAAGGSSWERGLRLDLAAPDLAPFFWHVDDAAPGGDGDGLAEPGETVSFMLTLENRGNGVARAVTATLRALAGATVTDSVIVVGDVAAGAIVSAPSAFTLAFTATVADLELSLATSYGQYETVAFQSGMDVTPAQPTGVKTETGATWAEVTWTAVSSPDLLGYNVYRAPGVGGSFERRNSRLEATAFFRDEGLSPETSYRYRVAAVDSMGNEGPATLPITVRTGPPYHPGFPVFAWNRVYSSPVPVDLDVNGDTELVCASQGWKVFAWQDDGSSGGQWPASLGQETISSPAVGNLDGDPQREVVIGANDNKLYAFNHDGTGLLNPSGVFATVGNWIQCTPSLGDLDLDGDLEIVVAANDGWVYAWHGNGTGYLQANGRFASFPQTVISAPAMADVDGDGRLEIFIGTTGSALYAWNHDGTPFRLPSGQFKYIGGGSLWAAPALGDIDADGQMEIVAASMNGQVYAYNMAAVLESGWPKATGNSIHSSPALGDLDRNGRLEVVVGSDDHKLYAWRYNGVSMSGFPITLPDSVIGSPVIGDITGDGFPDIVVGCRDHRVYAFQRTGQPVPGWPMRTYDSIWHSAPAIMDLDHDGKVEVAQGSYDGYFYVWDVSAPYDAATMDWPMFAHDRCRSGFAGWTDPDGPTLVGQPATGSQAIPPRTVLGEVVPNPANPEAVVHFDLAETGKARLSIYDVEGRLVHRLLDEERSPGRYQVIWRGFNHSGTRAASGVYFVRLEAGGREWTRKLVLVQ